MPEFNFADGQNKKLKQDRGSGDIPAPGFSSPSPEDSAKNNVEESKQSSVLDSYPERDLSHLTSGEAESQATPFLDDEQDEVSVHESSPSSGDNEVPVPDDVIIAAGGTGSPESASSLKNGGKRDPRATYSSWPLLTFLGVFIFFCVLAALWYFDPWPPLKHQVISWFDKEPVADSLESDISEEEMVDFPQEIPLRSWDFFVQVSSWKDLRKAEKDAEHFRARDFDVTVESEFLKARRSTFYRVRIGPFDSREEAQTFLHDFSGLLPDGVFIDSARIEDEEEIEVAVPAEMPDGKSLQRSGSKSRDSETINEFSAIDGPFTGYAVKVSSFKNVEVARGEARNLLNQGFPSFLTKKRIGDAVWYRVLVGPFDEKADADKYMRLINVAFGNEAYTIDLSLE